MAIFLQNLCLITYLKEVVEMAGYTERVDTLITVLEDCAKSKYKRKIASEAILNSKAGDKARRRKISDNLHKDVAGFRTSRREPSVCLEFDTKGFPLIQGLVTESTDDTILLQDVRFSDKIYPIG